MVMGMSKVEFHAMKRNIRELSKPQVLKICDELMLDDYEKSLLLSFYDNDSVVKTCMDNYISQNTYTNHLKIILKKIHNYYK